MRNALIVLAVIALVILLAGALNHEVAFNVDFVVGHVNHVSLVWVAAIVAAAAFAGGAVAMWLTHAAGAGTTRKLEAELRQTYERLRAAEAKVAAGESSAAPATVTQIRPGTEKAEPAAAVAEEPAVAAEKPAAAAEEPAAAEGEPTAVAEEPPAVEEAPTAIAGGPAENDGAKAAAGSREAGDDQTATAERTAVTVVDEAGSNAEGDETRRSGDDGG